MKKVLLVCWVLMLFCSLAFPMPSLLAQSAGEPAVLEDELPAGTTILEPVQTGTLHANMLENAGFEVPSSDGTIPGWMIGEGGDKSFGLSSAEGTFMEGKRSLRISGSGGEQASWLYSKPVRVTSGQLIKASGHFQVRQGKLHYAIQAYSSADQAPELFAKQSIQTLESDGHNEWLQSELSMTVPEGAEYIRVVLGTVPGESAEAYVDQMNVDAGVSFDMTDWGPPIETVVNSRAVFTQENGRNIMYMNLNGSSAHLAKIDLDSLTLLDQVVLPDTLIRALALGADGNVYIVGYSSGKLMKYDVQSSTVEVLTNIMAGHNAFDMVATPDGKLYGGTYSRLEDDFGRAFEYDIYTGKFTDLGVVRNGMKYIHSIAYDEVHDAVYFGLATDAYIRKYDRKQGQWSGEFIPLLYDGKNFTDLYKYTFDLDAIDGLVYARLSQLKIPGAGTSVVDLVLDSASNDEVIGTFPNNQAREVSPSRDGKVYFQYYTNYNGVNGRWLAYYDLEDLQVHLVQNPEPVRMEGQYNEFSILSLNREEYPGDTFVGLSAEGVLFTYNFETGRTETKLLPVLAEAGTIHSTGSANNGTIYMSGYTSTGYAMFDPAERKLTQFTSRTVGAGNYLYQGEMFIPYGGDQVLIPVYPGVIMHQFDPKKPWNLKDTSQPLNPVRLFGLDQAGPDKQERAYGGEVITRNGNETLAIVTTPARDTRTGQLVFYTTATKNVERYQPILNQSLVSMAYKDGMIYGGSSVWNSYGDTEENEPEAKMFIWDVEQNVKVKEFVPVPGKKAVTKLIVGPDGNIWGFAEGNLFIYDIERGEVFYNEPKFDIAYSSITFRDAFLEIGPDGNIYGTISGRLFMIDPETKNVYLIDPRGKRYLTQDNRGNLFMMGEGQHLLQVASSMASSANLINVKVNGEFIEGFDPDQLEYSITISTGETESVVLEPVAKAGDAARITLTPVGQLPGTAEIHVQSADGLHEKIYRLHLSSANAAGLRLDADTYRLRVGEKHSTVVYAVYGDGREIEVTGLSQFKSSRPTVADVDENGVVTAYSAGTAQITARHGELETAATVTVTESGGPNPEPVLRSMEFQAKKYKLRIGEQQRAEVIAVYSDGSRLEITDKVEFVNPSPEVAEIDTNGVLTGKAKGKTQITARYQTLSASVEVMVKKEK
ncbi:Streptogramin lyase [Chlamydia abortus]|nr:Streptogramin lyase [Chlamydia abortus]